MSIVKVLSIEDDGLALLACEGELNGLLMDNGESEGLEEHLGKDWTGRRVVLDMQDASYMDSAAVGWLLSLHKALTNNGGALVVCGVQPAIKRVIELMRIHEVLPIVETREQAIRRLREDA